MQLTKQYSVALITYLLSILMFNSCSPKLSNQKTNIKNNTSETNNTAPKDKTIKSDLETLHLKGKIKSIKQYIPLTKEAQKQEGKKYKKSLGNKLTTFNESGNEVEALNMDVYGAFINKCNTKFDQRNYKIERICYADTAISSAFYWKYNQEGQLIEEEKSWGDFYSWGGSYNKIVYAYNDKGQVERLREYDQKGNYKGGTGFEYDKRGNIQQEISYNTSDKQIGRIIFEYDEQNNLVLEKKYSKHITKYSRDRATGEKVENKGEEWVYKTTYAYNKKDQLTTAYYFENDSTIATKLVYVYDEAGNEVETKEYFSDGVGFKCSKAIYNEAGYLIRESSYNIAAEKWTEATVPASMIEYEVDKQGNWIKQRRYYSGEIHEELVREIVYN